MNNENISFVLGAVFGGLVIHFVINGTITALVGGIIISLTAFVYGAAIDFFRRSDELE